MKISSLVLGATLLLLTVSVSDAKRPPIIVPPDSAMEDILVKYFEKDGFSEVNMDQVPIRSYHGYRKTVFRYKLKSRDPIIAVYIIPPEHTFLNGSVTTYTQGIHYRVRCYRKMVVFESYSVGFFHVSIWTRKRGRYQRRAIARKNMILNAGMTASCNNVCIPGDKQCKEKKKDPCDSLPRDSIECPPNDDCNIISHDATILNGNLRQPIGNAVVVKTCDEFISAVCKKFKAKGGKVEVYVDAHGNNGFFVIGEHGKRREEKEYVMKGSDCYNKICKKLKNKISTITLFACSTAGGQKGADFIKCLAACLNATVKGWKKKLYLRADWGTNNAGSNEWCTVKKYLTPCVATPQQPRNTSISTPILSTPPSTDTTRPSQPTATSTHEYVTEFPSFPLY